jgi:acetyl-CoA carboxylase carboxyltransferase component
MTDYIFMVKGSSFMFITGPEVIRAVMGEEVSQENLGGAMTHNSKSGKCPFCRGKTMRIVWTRSKPCFPYLPANNMEDPPIVDTGDDPNRVAPELDTIIPDNPNAGYDMKDVIRAIVDNGEFFEPHEYLCTEYHCGVCQTERQNHRNYRQPAESTGRMSGY